MGKVRPQTLKLFFRANLFGQIEQTYDSDGQAVDLWPGGRKQRIDDAPVSRHEPGRLLVELLATPPAFHSATQGVVVLQPGPGGGAEQFVSIPCAEQLHR